MKTLIEEFEDWCSFNKSLPVWSTQYDETRRWVEGMSCKFQQEDTTLRPVAISSYDRDCIVRAINEGLDL